MKIFLLVIFILCSQPSYSRTQYVDEFLSDDSISEDRLLVLFKYSYKENEIENDNAADTGDTSFRSQQETLAVEYNFSKTSQVRFWIDNTHSFTGISQKGLLNDPFFIFWKRLKDGESSGDVSGDFGIEVSPSLNKGNLYKSKNGHQVILKYRFGLGELDERFHGTYFLGYKGQESFNQEGEKRRYDSLILWGLSLSGSFQIYKSFYASLNFVATKKSQNQAEVFYPTEDSGPSWETTAGVMSFFKLKNGNKISVGYRFKNESSTFNKFDNGLDIEDEQKSYFLSYVQAF